MPIKLMPDTLANKIAAGEVVERPASVVKELIENSIDANSTWVKIDIKEAGLQQIKVTDDGDGMSEEDCEIAFLRHATSKIINESDLLHVKTLGFRGEALASIASVSRVNIQTSQGDRAGVSLALEGGKVIAKSKSDARRGTVFTVNDLFYNTPARLKYMKTIHTELGHITDLLNRVALAHPEIRLEVTHNDRGLFRTAGNNDLLQVISQVYGMGVARKSIAIAEDTLDFSIRGYIAKPEVTRASRNYISIIINGRYIKNIPLSQAIIRAFHTLLPIGRYPLAVIEIDMDPILVDFNVHPAKLEVRFSKEKELVGLLEQTIRQALRQQSLIPEITQKPQKPKQSVQHVFDFTQEHETKNERPHNGFDSNPGGQTTTYGREGSEQNTAQSVYSPSFSSEADSDRTPYEINVLHEEKSAAAYPADLLQEHKVEKENNPSERVPVMYPIGQLHGTYILAQNETGFYMIDQHAAQERVKYEFFRDKLSHPVNIAQELLLPMTFDFSKQEAIFIEHYQEELKKVGLFFEPFGNQTYVIRSYPNWFPEGYEEEVIREMIEQIMQDERINVEAIRDDAAKLMSCKGSIKANHHLNLEDMRQLLDALRNSTDPFTCPHGRPIIVHFTTYELEKMFKRVM
ncbi:DNA mismatch repair endonuclease MutL [Virgibacillus halophilus]|uniref:DNA mismatch repair endonuclease MutL n=1 Tax=Tigheibacillus halophilus TaxID=361280 RepID=UPI00362996CA